MNQEQVNTLYDTDYAKAYNERYLLNPFSAVSMEVELSILRRVLHPDSRWLDIGCGTGYFLSRFPDIQRAGLDISADMLKFASDANPGALFFREGDFRVDVPEWKMAWSVVSCMWGAYSYVDSIKEVEQMVANMINWCEPGGAVFIPVVDLEDVRPNQQLPYKESVGVFGGALYLTSVTWTWVEEMGEKVHTHLVAPHVEHFVELLKADFDHIEIIRYPPYQAGWVSRKAVLATGRRPQADPSNPGKVEWQPIPPPVSGSATGASPLAFFTFRQLLGELFWRVRRVIRSSEWWEYKLAPLLAIGYATDLIAGMPLARVFPHLLLLLLGILAGAVYVSVINDITDIEEDAVCGKFNRMARVSRVWRWMIPACCLVTGGIFEALLYPDKISMFLYAMPWIAFSLYSFPPFRLKKRGFWGVLADASGSHLFVSVLMVTSTVYFTKTAPDYEWIAAIAVWSLLFGLRGILFHQFRDRENDIRAGLNTYAAAIAPAGFRKRAFLIVLAEMAAFMFIVWKIHYLLPVFAFILYMVVALVRQRFFGYTIINILAPKDRSFQIWMADHYQFFFPLSLLAIAAFDQPLGYVPLIVHCLLFPGKIWLYAKEVKQIVLR